jgi:hypothetical protein
MRNFGVTTPAPDTNIEAGDLLIAIGTAVELRALAISSAADLPIYRGPRARRSVDRGVART